MANTRIFARLLEPGRQLLVYQMEYAAAGSVAMILPIPVAPNSPESAVRFVSFEHAPHFFAMLGALFDDFRLHTKSAAKSVEPLAVAIVGSFEASFVPSQMDFSRLDPRFRIAPEVWAGLPDYADYGFVVFQLREAAAEPHPMAFTFPTRLPGQLFFPTVHVHDGKVHPRGDFDHRLYLQSPRLEPANAERLGLTASTVPARRVFQSGAMATPGVEWLDPEGLVFAQTLKGSLANRDTIFWEDGRGGKTAATASEPPVELEMADNEERLQAEEPVWLVRSAWTVGGVCATALLGGLGWLLKRRMR